MGVLAACAAVQVEVLASCGMLGLLVSLGMKTSSMSMELIGGFMLLQAHANHVNERPQRMYMSNMRLCDAFLQSGMHWIPVCECLVM